MDWAIVVSAVAVISSISGIVLGWLGRSRTVRQDAAKDGELRASLNYIRQVVDELRIEFKSANQRYDLLAERVTRVEESTKQAHKRIDRLEGRE